MIVGIRKSECEAGQQQAKLERAEHSQERGFGSRGYVDKIALGQNDKRNQHDCGEENSELSLCEYQVELIESETRCGISFSTP